MPDRGYITDIASQVSLPYRKPPETGTAIIRINGSIRVTIQNSSGRQLPYGKYPRLFELWAATMIRMHAPCVDFDTKTLTFDSSFRAFLQQVNVTLGGNTLGPMVDQLKRFFDCTYNIEDDRIDGIDVMVIPIAKRYSLAWGHGNRGRMDKGWVRFSDEFFEMLKSETIPVNLNVIAQLRGAMALDIYLFLNRRNAYLKPNAAACLPWDDLLRQFGSDCPAWKFRQNFEKALDSVRRAWTGLKVFTDGNGVILSKSPMTVPFRAAAEVAGTPAPSGGESMDTNPGEGGGPKGRTSRPEITEGFIARVLEHVGYSTDDPLGQRKTILSLYGRGLGFEEICERMSMAS